MYKLDILTLNEEYSKMVKQTLKILRIEDMWSSTKAHMHAMYVSAPANLHYRKTLIGQSKKIKEK